MIAGGWLFVRSPQPYLPRIKLPDGGEFRVFKITYTRGPSVDSYEHHLNAAPRYQFLLWRFLPQFLQQKISFPDTGLGGESSYKPMISIWWAYIDPKTGRPMLGPTDYATTTLDDGSQLRKDWPSPNDDYRQITITDPPTHSKFLHLRLSAEDHPVEFAIENPAYEK